MTVNLILINFNFKSNLMDKMCDTRAEVKSARKIVIKAGTSTVSTPEGFPSLPRMASIVESV